MLPTIQVFLHIESSQHPLQRSSLSFAGGRGCGFSGPQQGQDWSAVQIEAAPLGLTPAWRWPCSEASTTTGPILNSSRPPTLATVQSIAEGSLGAGVWTQAGAAFPLASPHPYLRGPARGWHCLPWASTTKGCGKGVKALSS